MLTCAYSLNFLCSILAQQQVFAIVLDEAMGEWQGEVKMKGTTVVTFDREGW